MKKKKSKLLSLAGKYNLESAKFNREEIYDEDLADDIKNGTYPDLTVVMSKTEWGMSPEEIGRKEAWTRLKPEIVFSFDTHKQHIVHDDYHPDHRILAHTVNEKANATA